MKPRNPFPRVTTAAQCHDWLRAEDVIRHALSAFYALCRHRERAEAEFGPGAFAGAPTDRQLFADDLAEVFLAKLHDQGFKGDVPGFHGWASETPAWWEPDTRPAQVETPLDIHRRALRRL
jgi:hypothetical protein